MISSNIFTRPQLSRALSFCLLTLGSSVAYTQATGTVYDRQGNPSFSEDGAEITYTPEQLGESIPLTPEELMGLSPRTAAFIDPNYRGVVILDPNNPMVPSDPNEPADPNDPVVPPQGPGPYSSSH